MRGVKMRRNAFVFDLLKWTALATLCIFVMMAGRLIATAQSTAGQPLSEKFSWSAELVSLDDNAHTVTVKTRVVGDQAPIALAQFKSGDRILLGWSGYDAYADAINRAERSTAAKNAAERFTFPADFVAYDAGRQYVTFKVPIPVDSVARLKPLKTGEWITATSPHGKTAASQPIVGIRPYVWSGKDTN
jgi:hypothetical protein